eukprot:scaffold2926_cov247-Pinguiococcus_pyrenoidosus.AAC.13
MRRRNLGGPTQPGGAEAEAANVGVAACSIGQNGEMTSFGRRRLKKRAVSALSEFRTSLVRGHPIRHQYADCPIPSLRFRISVL